MIMNKARNIVQRPLPNFIFLVFGFIVSEIHMYISPGSAYLFQSPSIFCFPHSACMPRYTSTQDYLMRYVRVLRIAEQVDKQ